MYIYTYIYSISYDQSTHIDSFSVFISARRPSILVKNYTASNRL